MATLQGDHERLAALLSPPDSISSDPDQRGLRRELYAHSAERVIDWLLLAWSGQPNEGDGFRAMIEDAKHWQPIALPVKGRRCAGARHPGRPRCRRYIKDCRNLVDRRGFRAGAR